MFGNKIECIDKCHGIPSHCPTPTMSRLSGNGVRPSFFFAHIASMAVQSVFGIVRMSCHGNELIDYIFIILRTAISERILSVERCYHVKSVEPHLVRIYFFVPKTSIGIPWMCIELTSK